MKYFIDTEFIEGFHKPTFGKRRHFIDLISIGIVCEDGREYYAISNEFNPKNADKWVIDNVISKLPQKEVSFYDSPRMRQESLLWKSNERISKDVVDFIYECEYPMAETQSQKAFARVGEISPQFYGYYSDYDWVLFCSLFGRMIDLPKGFPMYCIDLKQALDERVSKDPNIGKVEKNTQRILTFDDMLNFYKTFDNYPKHTTEHHALADAKWNRDLYLFLENITSSNPSG
jgi:hypothetical protein